MTQRLSDLSFTIEDNYIEIKLDDFVVDESGFDLWKDGVAKKENEHLIESDIAITEKKIMQEIACFPIETSTPMECMMFLSQVKKLCSKNGCIY